MKQTLREIYYLFKRGFRQSLRPYMALLPEFVMPVFFFVINSAGFQRAVDIPGFTGGSYLAFYAPVALLMAIFLSTGSAGIEVVTDMANGYMDRLFVAPIRRGSIILGKLLATGVRAVIQTAIMLAFLLLTGAPFASGLSGAVIIFALALLFGMAWSGVGLILAFLTQNPRAVQSSFIFFFPFTFVTTSQLPLPLLSGWYRTAVMANPVTYILEGMRSLMLTGIAPGTLGLAFLAAGVFALVTFSGAFLAFRRLSA